MHWSCLSIQISIYCLGYLHLLSHYSFHPLRCQQVRWDRVPTPVTVIALWSARSFTAVWHIAHLSTHCTDVLLPELFRRRAGRKKYCGSWAIKYLLPATYVYAWATRCPTSPDPNRISAYKHKVCAAMCILTRQSGEKKCKCPTKDTNRYWLDTPRISCWCSPEESEMGEGKQMLCKACEKLSIWISVCLNCNSFTMLKGK